MATTDDALLPMTEGVVEQLVSNYRRGATEARTVEAHARETDECFELELKDAVCACMTRLLPTLKPEYAEMIRRVDLQDTPLSEVASSLSITPNNATVRLHRARQALKLRLERSCGTCASPRSTGRSHRPRCDGPQRRAHDGARPRPHEWRHGAGVRNSVRSAELAALGELHSPTQPNETANFSVPRAGIEPATRGFSVLFWQSEPISFPLKTGPT